MFVEELAKQMKSEAERPLLLDVRTPMEREIARLEPSILIPLQELAMRVEELLPLKEECIVVYCHHGVRSAYAVQWLRHMGFSQVHNLEGGIDAWSLDIDPEVPRY